MCGKDLDQDASTVKPADALRVKVSVGSKTEWYNATVIRAGMLCLIMHTQCLDVYTTLLLVSRLCCIYHMP